MCYLLLSLILKSAGCIEPAILSVELSLAKLLLFGKRNFKIDDHEHE